MQFFWWYLVSTTKGFPASWGGKIWKLSLVSAALDTNNRFNGSTANFDEKPQNIWSSIPKPPGRFFLIDWNLPHLILFSEIISQKIEENVKK